MLVYFFIVTLTERRGERRVRYHNIREETSAKGNAYPVYKKFHEHDKYVNFILDT